MRFWVKTSEKRVLDDTILQLTDTVQAMEELGWMTFSVLHLMSCYQPANTVGLVLKIVNITRMWLFPAPVQPLLTTVQSLLTPVSPLLASGLILYPNYILSFMLIMSLS